MTKRKLKFPSLERAAKLVDKSRKALDQLVRDLERDRLAAKVAKRGPRMAKKSVAKTRLKMPALDRAIKLLEKDPKAFELKISARDGKRFLASLKKLDARTARRRRA